MRGIALGLAFVALAATQHACMSESHPAARVIACLDAGNSTDHCRAWLAAQEQKQETNQ